MSAVTVEREAAHGTRTRSAMILRALAESPVPLSTPELARMLNEDTLPYQQALARYGEVLRDFAAKGRVTRAGRTAGGWQDPPAATWAVTGAGREWLAEDGDTPAAAGMLPWAESRDVGRNARRLRMAAGRTLRDVAGKAGVALSTLCMYERGTVRIPVARTGALARVLGTTAEALAAGDGVTT